MCTEQHELSHNAVISTFPYPVIIARINVPRHSEVRNLDYESIADKTVSCCEISVHKMLRRQIHHAVRDLRCNINEIRLKHKSISHITLYANILRYKICIMSHI